MANTRSYHLNPIENRHTFDISAFVCAYDFASKPPFVPCWEQYDFSQIFLVLEGSGTYTTQENSFPLSPGMMFYRPAGQRSIYEWDTEKVKFGIISFVCSSPAMSVFEKAPVFLQESERSTLLDVIKAGVHICEPLRNDQPFVGMQYKPGTPDAVLDFIRASLERFFAMLYCRIMGFDLLREQTEKSNSHRDSTHLVENVKQYLAEHLSSQPSVKEICAVFGISQTALMKKFRAQTDKGLMEYFNDLKIREAKRLIRTTPKSFTEIADALGFSSVNYFSKVFKQKTGLTPTEFSRYVSKHG
ncbi:MAG: AraC family transcriptional regulator [Clostridia bacterium]|nr:AraC family transcriptional regulator [Clostridia bacterium]